MTRHRIAILMHENDDNYTLNSSLIHRLANYWREDGHDVFFLFGTDHFKPADLLFVHVDLSIVPDSYIEFAAFYPVTINSKVKDIRKSTFSNDILDPFDGWNGPVIVKSNKNCAGVPERVRMGVVGKVQKKLIGTLNKLHLDSYSPYFLTSFDYKIYNQLDDVPGLFFSQSDTIIQKFIPEMENGKYCVRTIVFLGDHIIPRRLKGKHPIVKGETVDELEYFIEPHQDVLDMISQLHFDYGKFDYVVVDGKPVILDINKTIGISPNLEAGFEMKKAHQYLRNGLYKFLPT